MKFVYTKHWLFVFLILSLIGSLGLKCEDVVDEPKHERITTTPSRLVAKNKKLLKLVEQKFMSFMGLSEHPNKYNKRNIKVPDHLWRLYYKWTDENYEDRVKINADTARLLYHNDEDTTSDIPNGNLHFNISSVPKEEKIHRAELLLFNERKRGWKRHKLVRLYKMNITNSNRVLAYYKKIRNGRKGYFKMDITDLIADWRINGVENSSIIVDIDRNSETRNSVHLRKHRSVSQSEWSQKRPLLMIYTQSGVKKLTKTRSKRNIPSVYEAKLRQLNETHQRVKRETCRLRPYRLDFKDFGWDEWIIAPDGYNINFCSGICPKPLGPHFNTTNHAVIQNAVLGINKHLVPPLCCIPTSFKDQTFLYLDSAGKLLLKTPVEMIALGCGCH